MAQGRFGPLIGRDVLLWPDNDAPGVSCMNALADHLRELGAASVRVLALTVFSKRPGLDGQAPTFAEGGEWAEGDDAAEALAKGWPPAHLAELERAGELFVLMPTVPDAKPAKAEPTSSRKTTRKPKTETLQGGFRLPRGRFLHG